MRTVCFAFVVAVGLGWQAPASVGPLVVVIDTDAPTADPREAARLRRLLLERVDEAASASYYVLSADRLAPVPAAEAADFRRTVFTVTPPAYSGVSVSFTESVEVLRGNESVRDELIARECPPGAQGCGGLIRAAVEAEVKRAEGASGRKLQGLVTGSAAWRGARVVLVTSGWPTRDESRVGLSRALDVLRRRGVSLTVVRQPPLEPYRGLVRDASESLAARLPAGFVTMGGDGDVARAEALVSPAAPTQTALTDSAPSVEVAAERPDDQPAPVVASASADSPPGSAGAGRVRALDATVEKAAAYVERFEGTFTGVLWHERYEQEDRLWRRFGASGAVTSTVGARRTLESEMFFAWLPQDGTWISVRDVMAVDGKAVPPGDRRLPALAARATVSLLELRDLARENGRYNIGTIVRTFNEPTLALLFLDARYRDRVAFTRKGNRRVDGRRLVTYAFVEGGSPTVIRSDRRNLPARGTIEIDEATGEVWNTAVEIADPPAGLTGTMTVEYRPHVAFDVLVPHEMREAYAAAHREQVSTVATYSDFRRFQTSGRMILTP